MTEESDFQAVRVVWLESGGEKDGNQTGGEQGPRASNG